MPALAAFVCLSLIAHDGDSLRCGRERIRIENIDAPELEGSSRCSPATIARLAGSLNPPWCDHALAVRSRDALRAFIGSRRAVIQRTGVDQYGRTLARVTVNGVDAGEYLVRRGLAREWVRSRRNYPEIPDSSP